MVARFFVPAAISMHFLSLSTGLELPGISVLAAGDWKLDHEREEPDHGQQDAICKSAGSP